LDKASVFVQIYTFYLTFGRKLLIFCPNLYFLPTFGQKPGILPYEISHGTDPGMKILQQFLVRNISFPTWKFAFKKHKSQALFTKSF